MKTTLATTIAALIISGPGNEAKDATPKLRRVKRNAKRSTLSYVPRQQCLVRKDEYLSWSDHNLQAQRLGCNLASISNVNEQYEIETLFADAVNKPIWIGAARICGSDVWEWTDGSSWSYTKWQVEPNGAGNDENRVLLDIATGSYGERYWNDVSEIYKFPAVYNCCETQPANICTDFTSWSDAGDGDYSCSWYAQDAESNCNSQHADIHDSDGWTAKEACCVCGGGHYS